MNLPPHIAKCITPTHEMQVRIERYARDRARLVELVDRIASDRISNKYRRGGLFSAPPPPIATEAREVAALQFARVLESEYAEIARVCPVASSLDAPLSKPEGA